MFSSKIRNISFRRKMTLLFAIVTTISVSGSGIAYYGFTQREIVDRFTENAESMVTQMENILNIRLETVDRKAFSALTNSSFIQPLNEYLNEPNLEREAAISSDAANWLKEIGQAEPLIHSVFLCTDQGYFDDYTKVRNWDFDFENSKIGQYFMGPDSQAVCWIPVMKDEIFADGEMVIPFVRRFTMERNWHRPAYLIIQLDERELISELAGNCESTEKILVLDSNENYICGTIYLSAQEIKDAEKNGDYLLYQRESRINGWKICLLKSRAELLNNVKRLRVLIVLLTCLFAGISWIVVAFLSRQMTFSLQKLSIQMNRMRQGEMEARYYYPYKDEVGNLARTFNYMADEIEKSMKKQEEYIALLQEEKEFTEMVQKQKRKAELRALQAQINPHFLYNTLNTITWMASEIGADEIRILSNSLGKFFRIGLSRGAESITVREEMEHIKSYLRIQEIRYSEIMEYEIELPKELEEYLVLKLVLQPLVENALYHGIKPKGGRNKILITGKKIEAENKTSLLIFEVKDTGVGIPTPDLEKINRGLKDGKKETKEGYGIYNVNERIKLYYGMEYGLHLESVYGAWTSAVLTIPAKRGEKHV